MNSFENPKLATKVLSVDSVDPDPQAISQAARVLRAGGLVAFPTETVYGLGANALDPQAVKRIYEAKGRPPRNPVIVHVADVAAAHDLIAVWPEIAERLASQFWPGPLTLVLPKSDRVPDLVTGGGPTVGVRMPAHPVALALLRAAQIPIAAPSANRSGYISPTRPEHVLAGLDGRIDMLLAAGPTQIGLESTVVDLTCTPPRVLRPGQLTLKDLERVGGPFALSSDREVNDVPKSPGLLERHYAPHALVQCVSGKGIKEVEQLLSQSQKVGYLSYGNAELIAQKGLIVIAMPQDPAAYGARLYAALHELDSAQVDRIIVSLPPATAAWEAIRDRLARAAAREHKN